MQYQQSLSHNTPQRLIHGHPADTVIMSFVLSTWSEYESLSNEDQVRVRFGFEVFLRGTITCNQLFAMMKDFSFGVPEAARQLIEPATHPLNLLPSVPAYMWTDRETLLLLAVLKWIPGRAAQILSHRSQGSRDARARAVVQSLQERRAMLSCSARELSIVQCPTVDVAPKYPDLPGLLRDYKLKVSKQENKCKELSLRVARLSKQLTNSQRALADMKAKTEASEVGLPEIAETSTIEANQVPHEVEEQPAPDLSKLSLQERLAAEFSILAPQAKTRRRYSPSLLKTAQLLTLTSRRGYRLLRQIFPLPCETCLWNHFGEEMKRTKQMLTDHETFDEQVESLTSACVTSDMINIGIDAFAFRTFHEVCPLKTNEFSNGFVFLHIPVNADQPVKVLHIEKKANGNYDDEIAQLFTKIKETYSRNKLKVWFKSTDGDRFLTQEHVDFFKKYVKLWRHDFNILVDYVYRTFLHKDEVIPVSDPLHFMKNARAKLVEHNVAVVYKGPEDTVTLNAASLEEILGLGQALQDGSLLGKMRDFYATSLFTLENVHRLLTKNCFEAALLLLPYASIVTVLYAENLNNEARYFFVHLAYLSFDRLFVQAKLLCESGVGIYYRHQPKGRGVTVTEPGYFKRMLNTCIAFGLVLRFGPRRVRLDAVGTHLVENAIGVARMTSNSTDYERIIAAFANGEQRKRLANELDLTIHVPRRINDGGAKVDTLTDEGVQHPGWDAHDVVSLLNEACFDELRAGVRGEIDTFIIELGDFISKVKMRKLSTPSTVANALIVERNFKYASPKRQTCNAGEGTH